jgi:hypothetical protein
MTHANLHPLGFLLTLSIPKASSATFNISYRIVRRPKYRKLILTSKVKSFVEDQLETIAQTEILESRVMPEDIQRCNQSQNIQEIPTIASTIMVWGIMVFIILCWPLDISAEVIEKYIQSQQIK